MTDPEYYVYFLIDPRDGEVFYIGKGKGNRKSQHVIKTRNGSEPNSVKARRIREILSDGCAVIEHVHASSLTEPEAFRVERELIRLHKADGGLTNIVGGVISQAESDKARAQNILDTLKPFDQWIATAGNATITSVEKVFGSTRSFYDWYKAAAEKFVRNPPQRYLISKSPPCQP